MSMEEMPPAAPSIPHSREAEEACVGSVLINEGCFPDISQMVEVDDFYTHRLRWIWECFVALYQRKVPIDFVTVREELEARGKLAEAGGPAFLTSLVNAVGSSLNAEGYAGIIRDHADRRKLIAAANNIAQCAYDEQMEIEKVREKSWGALEGATMRQDDHELRSLSHFAAKIYDHVGKWSKTNELPGIPTGFIDLDRLLANMQPSDFLIIAGRPGQGKTGFLTDVAYYNCVTQKIHPRSVAIFSLEMSGDSVATRLISKHSGINSQVLKTGKLQDDEWPKFTQAIENLSESGIWIDDTPAINPFQILAKCKRLKARRGLDLVLVDYLQLAEGSGDNRTQEVGYVSRMMKLIAKELDVPLLAAAQISRAAETRGGARPILSDLRESGSLEQDADIVIFIHQPDLDKPTREIIVAKQRNGPVGMIELTFRTNLAKFESQTTRQEPARGTIAAAWHKHKEELEHAAANSGRNEGN